MMDKVRDDKLWKIAKKRATFKMILVVYIIMNLVLVAFGITPAVRYAFLAIWPYWAGAGPVVPVCRCLLEQYPVFGRKGI